MVWQCLFGVVYCNVVQVDLARVPAQPADGEPFLEH